MTIIKEQHIRVKFNVFDTRIFYDFATKQSFDYSSVVDMCWIPTYVSNSSSAYRRLINAFLYDSPYPVLYGTLVVTVERPHVQSDEVRNLVFEASPRSHAQCVPPHSSACWKV